MEWEIGLQNALGRAFESKDSLAKVFEKIFNEKVIYLEGDRFSGRLRDVVAYDQPEADIRYNLIHWLKTNELAEVFVRGLVRLSEHGALYEFIESHSDFFLTYGDEFSGDEETIRAAWEKLTQIESRKSLEFIFFNFEIVLSEIKEGNKSELSLILKQELNILRKSVVPSSVKIFLMIEILIRDYPLMPQSSELALDRFICYLDRGINPSPEHRAQRAYLQILVQPGALDKTAILRAYLSFEYIGEIYSKSDLFPLRSEREVENFSEKKAVGAIVELIEDGEEAVDFKRDQGYEIDDSIVVEIFIPFQFLFDKVDRWQRRFGISLSETTPISQEHRIIFRSYDRLGTRTFRRKLKQRWRSVTATSPLSFGCTCYVDVRHKSDLITALKKSSVLLCTLSEADEVRESLVSAALEYGAPMVIWLENIQEKKCNVISSICEKDVSNGDLLEQNPQTIEEEKKNCLLFALRDSVSSNYATWGDFGDMNGLYSLIQEVLDNDDRFEGYFAILYDEPHRANQLAELLKRN